MRSFWLIIFRLLRSETLKKYLLTILKEKTICWNSSMLQTLNKIYDKSNFAMSSKLILPMQKWDAGCRVSYCTEENQPLLKISETLYFTLKNPGFKQKIQDKNILLWFIQNLKLIFTYPNNIGNTQVPFLMTCFCFASIVFILEVYCLCILSLLFSSSHVNYINVVTILSVCLSTASMGYFPDLPFLDHDLSPGSHSARACTTSPAVIFKKLS